MAIAFMFETDQFDQVTYDKLMAEMGLGATDAPFPPGCLAHVAGPQGEAGWRVVDVWESEAAGIRTIPWSIHRIQIPAPVATIS
jgi:hypothetical protein